MHAFFYSHLLDHLSDMYELSEDQAHKLIIFLAKQHKGDEVKAAKHALNHSNKDQISNLIRAITPPATIFDLSSGIPSHPSGAFSVPAGERLGDIG